MRKKGVKRSQSRKRSRTPLKKRSQTPSRKRPRKQSRTPKKRSLKKMNRLLQQMLKRSTSRELLEENCNRVKNYIESENKAQTILVLGATTTDPNQKVDIRFPENISRTVVYVNDSLLRREEFTSRDIVCDLNNTQQLNILGNIFKNQFDHIIFDDAVTKFLKLYSDYHLMQLKKMLKPGGVLIIEVSIGICGFSKFKPYINEDGELVKSEYGDMSWLNPTPEEYKQDLERVLKTFFSMRFNKEQLHLPLNCIFPSNYLSLNESYKNAFKKAFGEMDDEHTMNVLEECFGKNNVSKIKYTDCSRIYNFKYHNNPKKMLYQCIKPTRV